MRMCDTALYTIVCKECGDTFTTQHSRRVYCSIVCKESANAEGNRRWQREYYKRNRETVRDRGRKNYQRYKRGDFTPRSARKERIDYLNSLKERWMCWHCGFNDARTFTFHHREPEEKEFNLGAGDTWAGSKFTLEEIKYEVSKCDLICANCHRIAHVEMREAKY